MVKSKLEKMGQWEIWNDKSSKRLTYSSCTLDILLVALIILKLMGKITISWWWVFSPIWIPLGLIAIVLAVIGFVGLIIAISNK